MSNFSKAMEDLSLFEKGRGPDKQKRRKRSVVVQSKPTPEQIAENSRQGNAGNERAQRFAAFKEQSRQRHLTDV